MATAASLPQIKINVSSANVRSGPGTNFPSIQFALQDDTFNVLASNSAKDWYIIALDNGEFGWVASSVFVAVDSLTAVDMAETIPAPPLDQPTPLSQPQATQIPPTSTPAPQPTAVPVPTQNTAGSGGNPNPFQCNGGCTTPPDPSCAIKGNVNSSGERIYHLPGGAYYNRTNINPSEGDRWFCTEAEAQAAGFRRSQR